MSLNVTKTVLHGRLILDYYVSEIKFGYLIRGKKEIRLNRVESEK